MKKEEEAYPDTLVWDEHALDELRTIGGAELVQRVVAQSLDDAEHRLDELRQPSVATSRSLWHESAHALHGIAIGLGAMRLSQAVADSLELDSFDRALMYQEFVRHFADLQQALLGFLS